MCMFPSVRLTPTPKIVFIGGHVGNVPYSVCLERCPKMPAMTKRENVLTKQDTGFHFHGEILQTAEYLKIAFCTAL